MVLTMYGGGTPQSTSQPLSVPAYIRKKELSPGRKFECTRARMMGKFPDVQFGIFRKTSKVLMFYEIFFSPQVKR